MHLRPKRLPRPLLALAATTVGLFACAPTQADPAMIERLANAPQPNAIANAPEANVLLADDQPSQAVAVFAGGCFWCTEHVYEAVRGVDTVVSGYAGGSADTASYKLVSNGLTQHAEAIQITYDPAEVTYGDLLRVFFTVAHDPTQLNRQGPDVGEHYRSAVFFANDAQKHAAQAYIDQLTEAGTWTAPIVTTLEPLTQFHVAEAYHQDYVRLNPSQPYVVFNALPKLDKLKKALPEYLEETPTE